MHAKKVRPCPLCKMGTLVHCSMKSCTWWICERCNVVGNSERHYSRGEKKK